MRSPPTTFLALTAFLYAARTASSFSSISTTTRTSLQLSSSSHRDGTTSRSQRGRSAREWDVVPLVALRMSDGGDGDKSTSTDVDDGVVELADGTPPPAGVEEKKPRTLFPPFASQGEIDQDALNPDLGDPKQARVIVYIVLSLLPVLFLIPFMLSRELIPIDDLPPVNL